MKTASKSKISSEVMQYWSQLSNADQQEYVALQKNCISSNLNKKYKAPTVFSNMLTQVKSYIMKGDSFDKMRALTCGIYWYNDMLLINSKNLTFLLSRCRSSINNLMVILGYELLPVTENPITIVLKVFPEFAFNCKEARQWTVRKQINKIQSKNIM